MGGPDYLLRDVRYVAYFEKDYALHATYWHDNFGQPMSHGCVNLRTADAQWLYGWAPIGTPVYVHD
jgi:lipoprotein-anchoring transpeptidase ErfK/SrfK